MNKLLYNLLADSKHFLQALHASIGLDFNRNMYVFDITEKFTINQILKHAAKSGYTPDKHIFVILTRGNNYGRFSHYHVAALDKYGNLDIDIKHGGYNNNNYYYYNNFYAKSDFNDFRKKYASHTIVICQNREYLTTLPRHNDNIDMQQRFILKKVNNCLYGDNLYISSLSLKLTTDNGHIYQHDIKGHTTTNITEIIDKSGYLVTYRRDYLRNTAANIRAEKEKNNYISIDNTEKITALQAQIMQKKAEIIAILSAATTAEELSAINQKLSYFHGLEGIARDFENLRNNDAEKKYSSIDAFNNRYNDILSQLSAI